MQCKVNIRKTSFERWRNVASSRFIWIFVNASASYSLSSPVVVVNCDFLLLCKKKTGAGGNFWWVIQNRATFVTTTINHRDASLNCNFEMSAPSRRVVSCVSAQSRLEKREFSICGKKTRLFCSSSSQIHETPSRVLRLYSFQLVLFTEYLLLLLQIMRMLLSLRIFVHFSFISFFFLFFISLFTLFGFVHVMKPSHGCASSARVFVRCWVTFERFASRYERVFMAKT